MLRVQEGKVIMLFSITALWCTEYSHKHVWWSG